MPVKLTESAQKTIILKIMTDKRFTSGVLLKIVYI